MGDGESTVKECGVVKDNQEHGYGDGENLSARYLGIETRAV